MPAKAKIKKGISTYVEKGKEHNKGATLFQHLIGFNDIFVSLDFYNFPTC